VAKKTPRSSLQLLRSDFSCYMRDIHLMGIKPLDSGLWSGEWRLDVGRATTGETDFVVALGDICSEKNSGAQA